MRAVRGAEGVVDKNPAVAEFGEFLREIFLLLLHLGLGGLLLFVGRGIGHLGLAFLFLIETGVLDQKHLAGFQGLGHRHGFGADTIRPELDRLAEKFLEASGDGLEAEFLLVTFALRAAEMAHQDDRTAVVKHVLDGRNRRRDARVIGDFSVFDRYIEIHAAQHAASFEIHIANGFFVHQPDLLVTRNPNRNLRT